MYQLLLSTALLLLSLGAEAWQPDLVLRVSETVVASDCQPRSSIVINGTSPGPLLTFEEGQHYWIRVFNDIPDQNTTVHWHGFSQYASPFSDGTPLISAWPIPPGHFYDYEFQLEDGFIGTYWYHAHVGMQVITAQGPIIVRPKKKDYAPVQYDEELIMMMSDYYHADDATITKGILNTTVFGWLGEPQSLLVNGNALGKCNSTALKTGQNCTTQCGNNLQKVKPGKRYRVRVIGATVLSYLSMALEGHNMTLFEVDGTYIEPIAVNDLQLGAGQRYSVLIETLPNPPKADYYWRIRTMWRPTRVNGSALWTYSEDAPSAPYSQNKSISLAPTPTNLNTTVFLPNETFGWVSDEIVQWNKSQYPPSQSEVTRSIILNGQQLVDNKGFRWSVNNLLNNGTEPDIPLLLQLYSQNPGPLFSPDYTAAVNNGGYDNNTDAYPARLGEVLDIIIQNHAGPTSGMAEAHPWHSHGAKYWDMGAGPGVFSYSALNETLATRNGKPFLRDTSINYAGPGAAYNGSMTSNNGTAGWRLFRIAVQDPGAWLVHCHIAPHQVMGMQATFLYGADHLPSLPKTLVDEYKTFGGGAYGSQTYDGDLVPKSYFANIKDNHS